MTSKKTTRRALVLSLLSLLLCMSMLVGTTFAWFTDSVTSGVNKIVAGNLDVDVFYVEGDENPSILDATTLFNDVTLWEPGAVAYETFTVANLGTLALKFQLSVSFTNENTVNGYGLSDILKVGLIAGEVADGTAREAVVDSVSTWLPMQDFSYVGELAAEKNAEPFTMVIYWEPSAEDNNWNVNNGKVVSDFETTQKNELHIDLGIRVDATQLTAESDSFGPDYDENAPYSVWNGVVPAEMPESLVVDGTTNTIYVYDADAFVYLSTLSNRWQELYTDGNGSEYGNYANGAGANFYYSGNWTVSLEADIDLGNYPINPIYIVIGQSTGPSAFKGNNHFIRNINTTTGLFADNNRVTYSDLTLLNVTASKGALTGTSNTDITNVDVYNATINGEDYVGGLVGYTYGDVIDCGVFNSSVLATGKEAGGLIGYAASSTGDGQITGNQVRNVSVFANNRAAGLAAQVNVGIDVYENIIDTVTVGAEDQSTYKPDAVVSNALDAKKVYDNQVLDANVVDVAVITDNADKISNNSGYSIMSDDMNIATTSLSNGYAATGIKLSTGSTLDGNGNTLSVPGAYTTWASAISTTGGTIKNLTIDAGMRGIFMPGASADVYIDNVIIDGTVYTFNSDGGNKNYGVYISNSTLNGWTSFSDVHKEVVFTNCDFGEGSGYAFCRPYNATEFVGCDFEAGFEIDARAAITFENCTLDGVAITAENVAALVTYGTANATVK